VPSTLSIGEATINEAGNLSVFVPANLALLQEPRDMVFGPNRNADPSPDLYVLGSFSDNVVVYDGKTGAFIEEFVGSSSGLNGAAWLVFGPDGDLFTSTVTATGHRDAIWRVDQETKAVSTFVSNNPAENGGLLNARGMVFGPDGKFYVACADTDRVLRYDGITGAFIDAFVAAGSGGLDTPSDVLFGPDRNNDAVSDLYVSSNLTNQVLLYSGADGTPLGVFVAAGSGGIVGPHDMEFGADGHLYVAQSPAIPGFLPKIFRFDGATGAFLDVVVPTVMSGWVIGFFGFDSQGELYIATGPNEVTRHQGGPVVSLSAPSPTPVTVDFSTADGTATAGADYVALSGRLTFAPGETSKRILLTFIHDGVLEPSETMFVNLANASGATIADGQGEVTILDGDSTRFYVVNDATADGTYEYGVLGNAVENYTLGSGNTAPRGAASTAAGTAVWVVDANKKVYVYNPSGGLLGSWTAGSLHAQAQVEGIATNGTDVWIVDAKQDRVYRYTNAASRTSGSQNAASSFSLNSGNKNPKDIVTDGTYLWVVNDASTDKVFKYTVAGALIGSWTLTAGGGSPTGITLDPSNVNHLWVVDSGTDRVYQYDNAVSRTSGSQAASTSFALGAGNNNPQGIADPPAPDMLLAPASGWVAPSPAILDVPFAAWQSDLARWASDSLLDLLVSTAATPSDAPTSPADGAAMPSRVPAVLTLASNPSLYFDPAPNPLDESQAADEDPVAAALDSWFALLADRWLEESA
jgi:sugar lactone lactonase YvrE